MQAKSPLNINQGRAVRAVVVEVKDSPGISEEYASGMGKTETKHSLDKAEEREFRHGVVEAVDPPDTGEDEAFRMQGV